MVLSDECAQEYEFPIKIYNRPGLDRIQYRIAKYSQFRKYLLKKLDKSMVLDAWTHRAPDDSAFALLEGACILGDILTFYQELYANEAFIRTAKEKESITDLVRLIGYQLSPGLGGKAIFAVEVKGEKPITLPPHLPIKAEIEGMDQPTIFETKEEWVCYPALNKFYLYAPQLAQTIIGTTTEFYIDNPSASPTNEPQINPGDKILIGGISYAIDSTKIIRQEIVIVDSVRQVLDKTVFTIKGKLKRTSPTYSLIGYVIKNIYRHFGYNALPQEGNDFIEDLVTRDYKAFPLDSEVQDLAIGSTMLIMGFFIPADISRGSSLTLIREVKDIKLDNYQFKGTPNTISGTTSIIRFDQEINSGIGGIFYTQYDIRLIQFYETTGTRLTIKSMGVPPSQKGSLFKLYGMDANIMDKLKGRTLTAVAKAKNKKPINVTVIDLDKSSNSLQLDKELDYNDFPLENPTSEVYGNLVAADQGESQSEVLDAGDGREEFQTFKLSKSIMTYFNSAKDTPPEVPQLNIYVNNQLWEHVSSFFDRKPNEQIYVVKQDEKENSWVQFGDGITGSRLPSGVGNIMAKYRIGIGATGNQKPDSNIKALQKSDQIEDMHLYDIVTGGTQSENELKAKEAAPRKIQSLGRLVSLADYESEALSISGVIKASADLLVTCQGPEIVINVLTDDAGEGISKDLDTVLHGYDRCRGMQRYPINIRLGKFQYLYIEIDYGLDPRSLKEIVEEEIHIALAVFKKDQKGLDSTGLFGVKQRKFGQDEYASRVEGVVQNVSRVVWAKVKFMYSMGIADDPEELVPLAIPIYESTVTCEETITGSGSCQEQIPHVLRLYHKHLKLNDVFVKSSKEC
jgi:hypothetical protein